MTMKTPAAFGLTHRETGLPGIPVAADMMIQASGAGFIEVLHGCAVGNLRADLADVAVVSGAAASQSANGFRGAPFVTVYSSPERPGGLVDFAGFGVLHGASPGSSGARPTTAHIAAVLRC